MHTTLALYLNLAKPRILCMVLVTVTIGFFLGGQGINSISLLVWTLCGTALTSAGAGMLNHYLERDVDALMKRTCRRPLPSGLVRPATVLAVGSVCVVLGTLLLVMLVNLLCGFLALLTAFLYVLVYTPLKRLTWLNTFVGAIPGAIPPMGGWVAATGELQFGAWILFLILFFWQHPHFFAIAWMYRDDYSRGGLKMLPVVDPDGGSTFRQILVYSACLIPISLQPTIIGLSGSIYFYGALALGIWMFVVGLGLARERTTQQARKLLRVSVVYLPVLLALIVADASM